MILSHTRYFQWWQYMNFLVHLLFWVFLHTGMGWSCSSRKHADPCHVEKDGHPRILPKDALLWDSSALVAGYYICWRVHALATTARTHTISYLLGNFSHIGIVSGFPPSEGSASVAYLITLHRVQLTFSCVRLYSDIVLCEFSVGDVNECLHPIEGTNRLRKIDPIHVCLVEPVHLLGLPTGAWVTEKAIALLKSPFLRGW